ncbi:MAG: GNAT family N-acetyltransferase [Promicromonosporaceae bacterium]|nr:GNAT family N-acetyltransferase [Promicromonosporaceae bacterium]
MTRGPELRSGLARLRPMEARDAERIWEAVQDSEGLRLTGTTQQFTRQQIDEWAATISDQPGRYDWAITPGQYRDGKPISDDLIGEICLNSIDEYKRSANLRLQLLKEYRGRGYGGEAILAVLKFAFEGYRDHDGEYEPGPRLHRVSLDVLALNPRALQLYESLGFTQEGRLRDAHYIDGAWVDVILMSMLVDEYHDRHGNR